MTNKIIQLLRIHQHNPAESQLVVAKRKTARRKTVGQVNRRLVETKERRVLRSRFCFNKGGPAVAALVKEKALHLTKGIRWRTV
jgi:hypothetical protein